VIKPWALTHVSASQIETFRRCPREWYMEKILRFPRKGGRHFNFGSALHGCIERHLLGEDIFPTGWYREQELTMFEALKVRELYMIAVEERNLPMWLEETPDVELNFCISTMEDMSTPWALGFIDMLRVDEAIVTDWKTTGSFAWAKTPEELADNVQMNIYAKVLRNLWKEEGKGEPPIITLQHGVLLKENPHRGGVEAGQRTKLTEVEITPEHNEEQWQDIVDTIKEMEALASSECPWYDIVAPPKPSACKAFRGCTRKKVCAGQQSTEDHIKELEEQNDKQ